MKFAFALFNMEGLQGGHRFSAAYPEFRLGPMSWRGITILTMINGLVINQRSTFRGIFEPSRTRLYSLERGWAAAGCPVGRLGAPGFFMPTARVSGT
jgi:hypothetical protein